MDLAEQASVSGIHHITCVSSGPQPNVDFYRTVLGLRLVKRTVHLDSADVYHLYYGDEVGTPGTLITFFPFPHGNKGIHGAGSLSAVTFSVPAGSCGFWHDRFQRLRIQASPWHERLGDPVLEFEDHDGQRLELIASTAADGRTGWTGNVSAEHAIRFIQAATLSVRRPEPSIRLLTDIFGMQLGAEGEARTRLFFPDRERAMHLDVVHAPDGPAALPVPLEGVLPEAGTINHLAFGPVNMRDQLAMRERLLNAGFRVTAVKDRRYFKSIYTLDPNGIRLEVATGEPGFTVDEPRDRLGENLQLPPWLEARRGEYEGMLPPIRIKN